MKKFSEFLIVEAAISVKAAEALFGLTGEWTEKEMLDVTRIAISKAHPDHGGVDGLAAELIKAQKVLKKYIKDGRKSSTEDYKKRIAAARAQVMAELRHKFQVDAFTKWFSTLFGEDFTSKVEEYAPTSLSSYMAGFNAKWENSDHSKRFDMSITVDLLSVEYGPKLLGGGDPDISYTLSVVAYGYADNKKVKVAKSDYNRTNSHKILSDPKKIFPKAKITKKQTRKFAKRDMLLLLRNQAHAVEAGDSYFIPTKTPDVYVGLSRITFMRTAMWQVNDLFMKKTYVFKRMDRAPYISFPETEETGTLFASFNKMTDTQIVSDLNKKKKEIQSKR